MGRLIYCRAAEFLDILLAFEGFLPYGSLTLILHSPYVEKDATELFAQLTGDKDYIGLRINDNYGLEIIHKSGRTVPGRSSGYEHIVALSLIGALHKNAPLRGPIIMDSPFGRLDPTHKANIVRTLPSMAEQSILLAYTGEIDEQVARKELGQHLLREYKLERVSSMHTEIK